MSNTYATREEYLNAFIERARPIFEGVNASLPSNVRVAVGFTSRGSTGSRVGECWSSDASEDGYFEIFISPKLADAAKVCDVLTQQLIHAAIGLDKGRGPYFKRVAVSLGYTGQMTTPTASQGWYAWALPIINALGPMPYGSLATDGISSARAKQTAAMLKLECPVCDFIARTTKKHINAHSYLNCPVPDCAGVLICDELV